MGFFDDTWLGRATVRTVNALADAGDAISGAVGDFIDDPGGSIKNAALKTYSACEWLNEKAGQGLQLAGKGIAWTWENKGMLAREAGNFVAYSIRHPIKSYTMFQQGLMMGAANLTGTFVDAGAGLIRHTTALGTKDGKPAWKWDEDHKGFGNAWRNWTRDTTDNLYVNKIMTGDSNNNKRSGYAKAWRFGGEIVAEATSFVVLSAATAGTYGFLAGTARAGMVLTNVTIKGMKTTRSFGQAFKLATRVARRQSAARAAGRLTAAGNTVNNGVNAATNTAGTSATNTVAAGYRGTGTVRNLTSAIFNDAVGMGRSAGRAMNPFMRRTHRADDLMKAAERSRAAAEKINTTRRGVLDRLLRRGNALENRADRLEDLAEVIRIGSRRERVAAMADHLRTYARIFPRTRSLLYRTRTGAVTLASNLIGGASRRLGINATARITGQFARSAYNAVPGSSQLSGAFRWAGQHAGPYIPKPTTHTITKFELAAEGGGAAMHVGFTSVQDSEQELIEEVGEETQQEAQEMKQENSDSWDALEGLYDDESLPPASQEPTPGASSGQTQNPELRLSSNFDDQSSQGYSARMAMSTYTGSGSNALTAAFPQNLRYAQPMQGYSFSFHTENNVQWDLSSNPAA